MDFGKVADIASWILLGVGIIFVLWYVFGSSPTIEQSISFFMLGAIFKIYKSLGKLEGKLNEHMRNHK